MNNDHAPPPEEARSEPATLAEVDPDRTSYLYDETASLLYKTDQNTTQHQEADAGNQYQALFTQSNCGRVQPKQLRMGSASALPHANHFDHQRLATTGSSSSPYGFEGGSNQNEDVYQNMSNSSPAPGGEYPSHTTFYYRDRSPFSFPPASDKR